jgi:hypothetical protein
MIATYTGLRWLRLKHKLDIFMVKSKVCVLKNVNRRQHFHILTNCILYIYVFYLNFHHIQNCICGTD